jgi:hypothetical protein
MKETWWASARLLFFFIEFALQRMFLSASLEVNMRNSGSLEKLARNIP